MPRSLKFRITTVRQRITKPAIGWLICPVCRSEVDMLTKPEAAELLEIDDEALDRLITSGQVHTIQTISNSVRICKNSLFSK